MLDENNALIRLALYVYLQDWGIVWVDVGIYATYGVFGIVIMIQAAEQLEFSVTNKSKKREAQTKNQCSCESIPRHPGEHPQMTNLSFLGCSSTLFWLGSIDPQSYVLDHFSGGRFLGHPKVRCAICTTIEFDKQKWPRSSVSQIITELRAGDGRSCPQHHDHQWR